MAPTSAHGPLKTQPPIPSASTALPTGAGTAAALAILRRIPSHALLSTALVIASDIASSSDPTASDTTASAIASQARDASTVSPSSIPRRTLKAVHHHRARNGCIHSAHDLLAHLLTHASLPSIHPNGARTARRRAQSQSGMVFCLGARESVSKNEEYSGKGAAGGCDVHVNVSWPTSTSEQRVGCLNYRRANGWRDVNYKEERRRNGRGGKGNRRTWDEPVALDTVGGRERRPCGRRHRAQNLGEATTATMCSPTSGTGRVER
ncbi:hypothetical protein B0H14DRAFT_2573358 [Mycena olivaceomarginata]|nr:hypothetical protein B0H14DRAFT_2573358 [Mycena olivaceomarginata]